MTVELVHPTARAALHRSRHHTTWAKKRLMQKPRVALGALSLLYALVCAASAKPPYLPPGEFEASGNTNRGIKPFLTGIKAYNGSFDYVEYPGGNQQGARTKLQVIYYDSEIPTPTTTGFFAMITNLTACGISLPHTHPGVAELNYVLEGDDLIAGLFLQTVATGTTPTWATGASKGGVLTVPAGAIHYAENPGCGTASLLQVLAGLPKDYDYLPYIDLPGVLLSQDAGAMQAAYGLTDAQLQNAIESVRPLFAVNTTCLAKCNSTRPQAHPAEPSANS